MRILTACLLSLFSASVFAKKVVVQSCEENSLSFNRVSVMKSYADGAIKIFELDNIEPVAIPYGVVVTLDRGEDIAEMESFCRYVPELSYVDVNNGKSSYSAASNTMTLKIPASQFNSDTGNFDDKTLTLKIVLGAKSAQDTVSAELN